jgi:hypothetical protein
MALMVSMVFPKLQVSFFFSCIVFCGFYGFSEEIKE